MTRTGCERPLGDRGTAGCIPHDGATGQQPSMTPTLYRHRHRIENALARLKDWRRIATRNDRCADLFPSAVALAAALVVALRNEVRP